MSNLEPSKEDQNAPEHHTTDYNWEVQFVIFPSALTESTSSDLNSKEISIQAPIKITTNTTIPSRRHKAHLHTKPRFHKTDDSKVEKFLKAWMDICS